nr:hypothetical protein C5F59_39135 [Streptomyces sp. QL37]
MCHRRRTNMIRVSPLVASALLTVGALCLPAQSATAQTPSSAPVGHCENEGDLLPDSEDPGSHYHCSHGEMYLKDCPSSPHFNPVLKVCDWPENSGRSTAEQEDPTPDRPLAAGPGKTAVGWLRPGRKRVRASLMRSARRYPDRDHQLTNPVSGRQTPHGSLSGATVASSREISPTWPG